MVLRLLGTAVTDANGLAVLSDGYTGTGAGLVDIIAQTTIDESTVVSQPSTITDCLFLDYATTGKKNTKYNCNASFQMSDPTDNGTTLTCTSETSWGQYFHNQTNNTSKPQDIGTCIEFDVNAVTNCDVQLQGDSLYRYQITQTGHYKIVVDETHITTYKDGTQVDQKSTSTYISSTFAIKFAYRGIGQYITFANVMIYPI